MEKISRAAALFDFDGTLTKRSTVTPFFRASAGSLALTRQAPRLMAPAARYALGKVAFSEVMTLSFERLLLGKREEDFERVGRAIGERLARGGVWSAARAELLRRAAEGERVAIVTGGLPYCARGWLLAEGLLDQVTVFASSIQFDETGRATGLERVMVRENKLAAVEWARDQGSEHISAFGNSEGDFAMLTAAHARWWVDKKGALSEWKGAL